MKIINWEGSAILGPGSEWFWAAAQFFVVVVSLYGIYRQLRAQGAINALQRIESLQGQWTSSRMAHTKLALALNLKYEALGSATWFKAKPLADFFANLYDLHEEGYISLDEIAGTWGRAIQIYWAMLAPAVNQQRLLEHMPALYDGVEELASLLRTRETKLGIAPLSLDPSTVAGFLDHSIQMHTEILRQEQEFRSGVIPAGPSVPPAIAAS